MTKKHFNNIKERDDFIRKLSKKIITIKRQILDSEIRDILIREYGIYRTRQQINTIKKKRKYNDKTS